MDKFPEHLSTDSKHTFPTILEKHLTSKLRLQIYEFILRSNEEDYFVLNNFFFQEKLTHIPTLITSITNNIISELNSLGWTTKLAFGGTGLYIYSTTEHRSKYFEDIIS